MTKSCIPIEVQTNFLKKVYANTQYLKTSGSIQSPMTSCLQAQEHGPLIEPLFPKTSNIPNDYTFLRTSKKYADEKGEEPKSLPEPFIPYLRASKRNDPYLRTSKKNDPFFRTSKKNDPYFRTSKKNDPFFRTSKRPDELALKRKNDPFIRTAKDPFLRTSKRGHRIFGGKSYLANGIGNEGHRYAGGQRFYEGSAEDFVQSISLGIPRQHWIEEYNQVSTCLLCTVLCFVG